MNDLKNSTLGERVLLGIIAGLFGIVGFYVGYEHLSHGVNPILIGIITAIVVMIGSMAAAFVIEELLRRVPAHRKNVDATAETKQKKEKAAKEPRVKKEKTPRIRKEKEAKPDKEESQKETQDKPVLLPSEKPEAKVVEEPKPNAPLKRMTLSPTMREKRVTQEETTKPTAPSKPVALTEPTKPVESEPDDSAWDLDEPVVLPVKVPQAPTRPTLPTRAQARIEEKAKEETPVSKEISLVDFIKAHPDLSARRMVKEYRQAGGTESTDNILELMN